MPNLRLRSLFSCFNNRQQSHHSSEGGSIEVHQIRPRTTSRQVSTGTASVPASALANARSSRPSSPEHIPLKPSTIPTDSTRGRAVPLLPSTSTQDVPYTTGNAEAGAATIEEEVEEDVDAITPAPLAPSSADAIENMPTGTMYKNVKNALEDRRRLFERLRNPNAASTEAVVGTARWSIQPPPQRRSLGEGELTALPRKEAREDLKSEARKSRGNGVEGSG